MSSPITPGPNQRSSERRVLPLELFFDLVFVLAITQVTAMMAANPTWEGLGRGMLVLAAIWWAWGAYSWLTNEIEADEVLARLVMVAAMAAMLVAALAIPDAFGDNALVFGVAYFVVRALHILLFAAASPHVDVQAAVRTLATTAIPAPALLIVAGFVDEGSARVAIWIAALAIDYLGPRLQGVAGFHISPGHFAERYGLIMIIALGESIVAIGVGSEASIELHGGEIVGACLGVVAVAALWWAYFDVVAIVAEQRLRAVADAARATLARDAYSYLHLPMLAGVVLLALGIKKTLEHVGDPLDTVPAVALCAGVAIYLLAHVAFRRRMIGSVSPARIAAALASLALIPLATNADALLALAAITLVLSALIAYEVIAERTIRARVRAAA